MTRLLHSAFRPLALFLLLSATTTTATADSAQEAVLSQEISTDVAKVAEFSFIREEARKLGIRAWLFGGTAAGFGHYVEHDLKRRTGQAALQAHRYDFSYTNIYHSNQDLDIVIDGSPQQAEKLQNLLSFKFPYLQGKKTAWEVRLLNETVGTKAALLGNADFLNQHTDSNSTGMIELTQSWTGEPVVRDLRDWNSRSPAFLKDLAENKLHFYFSPTHEATSRFRSGENPPIIAAIRYFTKAFQYQLEMRPEDVEILKKIVAAFDPARDATNPYVRSWIERNGKKLIQNASNMEYAYDTLDRVGLRSKLISVASNADKVGSLSWWMSRQPLRDKPLGTGSGLTAADYFRSQGWPELVVAHDCKELSAYESINRSPTGLANVLESRNGALGETAVHGDGFYVLVGKKGAWGSGFNVRFELDPAARLGTDFLAPSGYPGALVIRNRRAIRIVPDSLALNPVQFFEHLVNGGFNFSEERGILEQLNRRLSNSMHSLSAEDSAKISRIMDQGLHNPTKMLPILGMSVAKKHPDWPKWLNRMSQNIQSLSPEQANDFTIYFGTDITAAHEDLVESMVRAPNLRRGVQISLNRDTWRGHPRLGAWLDELISHPEPINVFLPHNGMNKDYGINVEELALIFQRNRDNLGQLRPQLIRYAKLASAKGLSRILVELNDLVASSPLRTDSGVLSAIRELGDEDALMDKTVRGTELDRYHAQKQLMDPKWHGRPKMGDWLHQLISRQEFRDYGGGKFWPNNAELIKTFEQLDPVKFRPQLNEMIKKAHANGLAQAITAIHETLGKKEPWKSDPSFQKTATPGMMDSCIAGFSQIARSVQLPSAGAAVRSIKLSPALVVPVVMTVGIGGTLTLVNSAPRSGSQLSFDQVPSGESIFKEEQDPACRPTDFTVDKISAPNEPSRCSAILDLSCYQNYQRDHSSACDLLTRQASITTLFHLTRAREHLTPEVMEAISLRPKPFSAREIQDLIAERSRIYKSWLGKGLTPEAAAAKAQWMFVILLGHKP